MMKDLKKDLMDFIDIKMVKLTATNYKQPIRNKTGTYKKKDITILFIPNILSEEGRILISLPYNRDWTIRRYLKKSRFEFKDMHIEVNGNKIKSLRQHLNTGDEIIIIPKIETPLAAWWAAATFWHGVARIVAAASAAYSIYSAITYQKPKTPSFDTSGDGMDADSPSSSWDGVRTTSSVGTPIPIIIGERLTGGNVLNEYVSTDGDKNYLRTLLGICQGEVDSITLVRINRNAAANYSGYTLETRLGTNDQTVISDFHDSHNLKSVGIQLTKNNAYTYTTEDNDLEAFEVHLQLPSGLWQQDASGNILAYDVTYKVEYKLHSSGDWTDLGSTTISAKSRSALKRIFRKSGLTTGQYDIRVTKTSDDSDFTHTSDLYIERIDEISCEDEQEFPNIATAGVKSLAMDQLSGAFPDYEFLVRGSKMMVPKVMNGAADVGWDDYYWDPDADCYKLLSDGTALTWDGVTFTTAYSANPIWGMYYLMTFKRAGLGHFITSSDHNLDYLVEMSQYCEERVPDGLGGYEKRFRMDICIDSPQKALDLIMQLCSIFRGMPFYSDKGQVKICIEKPDIPVQLFGMGNIIKDSFSETWGSIRDVPNIVNVQFDDEDNNYETCTIQAAVDDEALAAGKPINIKTIRYYGTKLSYAIRHGRNYLKVCKYISNTIKIKAGIGAIVRQCGELVDVAHDVPQWGFSGRVKDGSTTTKVKLDRSVIIESGKSYAIRVDFSKGAYEERTITDPTGTYTEVTVNSAFTNTPLDFDSYSFGEVNKIVKPARIVSLKRKRNFETEIEAVEYNENIFDDSTIIIPQSSYSSLTNTLSNVENLKLTERMAITKDGKVEDVLDIWWNKPAPLEYSVRRFAKAKIYISENAGLSWIPKGESSGEHFAISEGIVDLTDYKVVVVSVSANGEANPIDDSPQENISIIGKSAPPADVSSFLVNQSRDRLYFGWTKVNDADLSGYEIRYGSSWNTATAIASNIKNDSLIRLDFRTGDNQSFWIKAIDTTGNYSLNATEAILSVESIPFTNVIESYSEQTGWAGTKVQTVKVGNNLKLDTGYLTGTYETPVRDIGYVATFKIGIETAIVDASSEDRMDDSEIERMNDSETDRMSGRGISGAATFEIKTSEDNITWSAYAPWQAGDYKCRYFQIRMTMTRATEGMTIQCSQLNYYSDLPDVDEFGEIEITDAGAGIQVVYSKTFHQAPVVAPQILSGDGRVVVYTAEPDLTDFTAKLYDLAGVAKAGRFSYHIHGV
jgi:predicted phage tail protein